jgi:hypothetical protein
MVIRSSSARQVDTLIAQLHEGSPVQRDAAIARLRVIGARAVDRLVRIARSHSPDVVRIAALKALEAIDDPRSRDAALGLLGDSSSAVAAAAVGTLRPKLVSDAIVLDAITALALDKSRHPTTRLAALDALAELPRPVIQPVLHQITTEDTPLSARAGDQERADTLDQIAGVREWLAVRGANAPLSELHDTIVRIRDHERDEPSARLRQEWQMARAAAHHALARRNSRVALYDLRETFDAASAPVPLDFLTAAMLIGDRTCLEPMARAWEAAGQELWWRDRLATAARTIVSREKLTARNAVIKRIQARHPGFLG